MLIWAIVLVQCSGISRALVVCTGPHCDSRVEFLHPAGACCDDSHEVIDGCAGHQHGDDEERGRNRDGGDQSEEPGPCGCTDVPVAIDDDAVPERLTPAAGDSSAMAVFEPMPTIVAHEYCECELPPPTGPPRVDRRIELLATTVLLI